MKAAIYARYSSDKQSESSIQDQISICQARASRESLDIAVTRHDEAISGSTPVAKRPGGNALLADALAGRFDVLILEGLDRLSRDQVEQESIVRRLEHRNIRIIGVADGYDSRLAARKVMRSVRGLINELYLDDLRHKTQRGLMGQFERGFIASGKCYGYRIIKEEHGSRYQIDDSQAPWVRWIFEQAAAGATIRSIVYTLNEKGIPAPRGSSWCVSGIYGSPVKGSGILNNRLYVGEYVWNRSQWIKDPETGRRQRRDRPVSEWMVREVPELRIIPPALWGRVRTRIDEGRGDDGRKQAKRPTSSLLGGLMHCPVCGGPVVARNSKQYGCNRSHDRGHTECVGWKIDREKAESAVVRAIKEDLLCPTAANAFEQSFMQHVDSTSGESQQIALERKAAKLQAEAGRLVDALAEVGISSTLKSRLQKTERELDDVRRQIKAANKSGKGKPNVEKVFGEVLIAFEQTLRRDTKAANVAIKEIFTRLDIEVRGDQVWAKAPIRPALQMAAGMYNGRRQPPQPSL